MRAAFFVITFLGLQVLSAMKAPTVQEGHALAGTLPRLPAGLPPLSTPEVPSSFLPLGDAPAPTAAGEVRSSPSSGWWAASPDMSHSAKPPLGIVGGLPFISSSPAVPLPMGEKDAATFRTLDTPGEQGREAGLGATRHVPMPVMLAMAFVSYSLGM
ncbi:hypothetical protein HPP92_018785 [Vanilla planifolia]|uniref:Uncharacterized protein n=1 Tax=Vanilla planifolia TaxID=51239 RepID=A0A835UMA9_VANPL|nr:hypothetical protein HPP92_018785 [Vanilla planifolia]